MKTMDISNKTLALFLLAAMVVSLGGTIMSLSQLSDLSATGLVTDTGTVNVDIAAAVSITTEDDSSIDFGECTPLAGVNATVNSEGTGANQSICAGITGPGDADFIAVRNNGNVPVTLDVTTSQHGEADGGTFLDSDSGESRFSIKAVDDGTNGNNGGCAGTLLSTYEAFTDSGSGDNKRLCDDLSVGASANSILAHVEIVVPFDAPTAGDSLTLTFDGQQV